MKILKHILMFIGAGVLFVSCDELSREPLLPYPNDVTFNKEENSIDVEVLTLDFVQFDAPFTARAFNEGSITLNAKKKADGTHIGFALSNKNNKSYPFCTAQFSVSAVPNPSDAELKSATDTALYSVYTTSNRVGFMKNFAVVRVEGEEPFFTIDKPRVVEHVLVANCTFNYLALQYGGVFSSRKNASTYAYEPIYNGNLMAINNPGIQNTALRGVWSLPDYYNFSKGEGYIAMMANPNKADGYLKVIATGYNGNTKTGTSEFWLAVRTGVAPAPYDKWNQLRNDWLPWDLSTLGTVDKVVFTLDSSEKRADGSLKLAPYFCIDGIRLK